MHAFLRYVVSFLRSEEGPTAVEYAMMLALIIIVCVAAISSLGNKVDQTAEIVSSTFNAPSP
jgi:pilus assembly protein Flp/PilA